MNTSRYRQFLLESRLITDSARFATDRALLINKHYENLSDDQVYWEGPQLLLQLEHWEGRLAFEKRQMESHLVKYKEFIIDDEI